MKLNIQEMIQELGRNDCIRAFIPMETLQVLPRLIFLNNNLCAEVLYYPTKIENGKVLLYPFTFRILYDLKRKSVIKLENLAALSEDTGKWLIPCGVMEHPAGVGEYVKCFNELEDSCKPDDEKFRECRELWEKTVPSALRLFI